MVNRDVRVNFDVVSQGENKLAELTSRLKQLRVQQLKNMKGISKNIAITKEEIKVNQQRIQSARMNNIANQGFFSTLRMGQADLRENANNIRKNGTFATRAGLRFREMTTGLGHFRMEMLGVLFFGMFLQRTLTGLLRTSLEWVGVTEILSTAMGILFLPVALLLLDWAIMFLEWVTSLTDEQKKLIGSFVLLGIAAGGLLFLFGTLVLGIGAMIAALGFLLSPLGVVLTLIAGLGIIAGISTLMNQLSGDTDELKEKLVGFGVSGESFDMIKEKLIELGTTLQEQAPVWEEKGRELASNLIDGIFKFVEDNPSILIGALVGLVTSGPMGLAMGASGGFLSGKLLAGVKDGTIDTQQMKDAAQNMTETILQWIQDNGPTLFEIGAAIAGGIGAGFNNKINDIFSKGLQKLGMSEDDANLFAHGPQIDGEVAIGGPVSPNSTYLVGEKGPELFSPSTAGRITPNGDFGGGVTIVQNITASGSNAREFEELIKKNNIKLTEEIRRLVKV